MSQGDKYKDFTGPKWNAYTKLYDSFKKYDASKYSAACGRLTRVCSCRSTWQLIVLPPLVVLQITAHAHAR